MIEDGNRKEIVAVHIEEEDQIVHQSQVDKMDRR